MTDTMDLTLITVTAELSEIDAVRAVLLEEADEYLGVIQQRDAWLRIDEHGGGLLVRSSALGAPAVIEVERGDRGPVCLERHRLTVIDDADRPPPPWGAMVPVATVRRARELWVAENVRLYLDTVAGVGLFLSMEAVVDGDHPPAACREAVRRLLRRASVPLDALQTRTYPELAQGAAPPDPEAARSAEIERMKEKLQRLGPGEPEA